MTKLLILLALVAACSSFRTESPTNEEKPKDNHFTGRSR